jgi:putative heme-binding domain-containing protein
MAQGYKASIVNILESQKDQWFRPIDVAVAPDGSLFVADWYDPGVGGHQAGDVDRGRIYRIAPPKTDYKISPVDVSSVDGAVAALLNPNALIRFKGWKALEAQGDKAEGALQKLWNSSNQRHRAQALWLLCQLPGKRDEYMNQALKDADANIRITGIRVARLHKVDIIPIVAGLKNDNSPQVRRELAIALRGNKSPQAAELWTDLALQYNGKDRWYLEALGIAAAPQWDLYFKTWKSRVGKDWTSPTNRDIVWRSRAKDAMPMMAELIKSSDEKEMLRYYRSFDFQTDPSKQQILAQLVQQTQGERVLYALKAMDASKLKMTPAITTALNKVLDGYKGKIEYVELVTSFKLKNRSKELLNLCLQYPDSLAGREAARTLLNWDETDLISDVLKGSNKDQSLAMIKTLRPHMYNQKAIELMESVMLDSARDIEVRKVAVKSFGGPWQAEDRLLALAKENKIPEDLHTAAGGVFQTAWRAALRTEASSYLKLPAAKEGASLPPIAAMVDKHGDAVRGKEVFKTLCSNCHVVKGDGVNFGPELSEIGDKLSREALYTSVLFPDQGISFGFEGYRLQLNDGSTAVGKIASETAEKVDLQYMSTQQTVAKENIVSRVKLESSLMPSSLQASMSEQELIDLVEYLASLKKDERLSAN